MSHHKGFKKAPIAAGVALAVASQLGFAQDAPTEASDNVAEPAMEEVIVTGIRQSLQKSADIKRDNAGVVDAITAEDIGAFPDTNLAEALQRVTGVAIDRTRGEGQYVTVRGFGPAFNLVTLNGRQMPTTGGDSRSFDFSNDRFACPVLVMLVPLPSTTARKPMSLCKLFKHRLRTLIAVFFANEQTCTSLLIVTNQEQATVVRYFCSFVSFPGIALVSK